jgi:ubiquinone/menaquinone biosynthesis C-methylase UbiE
MGFPVLKPSAVKEFYDRFGPWQDYQAFYEDGALNDLVTHAAFAEARDIVEFGCGTGRFASRILGQVPQACYAGFDVSTTMIALARSALARFGQRASVHQLEPGTAHLPVLERSADRLIATYVLDLLPPADIERFFHEALRILRPDGRLCIVSLSTGVTACSRLVTHLWSAVYHLRPQLVGGCRPIHIGEYYAATHWDIVHHRNVVSWGIASEVLVMRPHAA